MKRKKSGLLTIFLSMMFFIVLNCQPSIESQIDDLFKKYSGKNDPGAALMVIKNGEPILIKTYGLAQREEYIPVTPETNFRLASVTKQFTALCILKLAEQNKLSFDLNLKDIFPEFADYGREITIHHLVHHTSGLIDYESLIPDSASIQVLDQDVLNMMMAQDSTYFKPGAEYRYSNSAYAVLAKIVEKFSGKTYATFLKGNIFEPLEMTNTVAYEKNISEVTNRAFGYAAAEEGLVPKDQSLTSAVLGDGGIYSSAVDLFKWDQALYTEKLLSSEFLRKAFTPDTLANGASTGYGFGWRIDEYKSHYRVHHTGQSCGFATIIQRYPEDKFSVIILTNRDLPMLNEIADKIVDLFLVEKTE